MIQHHYLVFAAEEKRRAECSFFPPLCFFQLNLFTYVVSCLFHLCPLTCCESLQPHQSDLCHAGPSTPPLLSFESGTWRQSCTERRRAFTHTHTHTKERETEREQERDHISTQNNRKIVCIFPWILHIHIETSNSRETF